MTVAVATLLTLIAAAAVKLVAVLFLLYVVHVPRPVLQGQDALITGVLAASFVWVLLGAERLRQQEQAKQIKVVADLNHHLRNALEVILASDYLGQDVKAGAILKSVERIDNALTAIVGPVKAGERRPVASAGFTALADPDQYARSEGAKREPRSEAATSD